MGFMGWSRRLCGRSGSSSGLDGAGRAGDSEGVTWGARLLAPTALATVCALPGAARAELVIGPDDAPRVTHRALVWAEHEEQPWLERTLIMDGAPERFALAEPIPGPVTSPEDASAPHAALERVCARSRPLHHHVEERPLGPSLLSAWLTPPSVPAPPAPWPTHPRVEPAARRVFEGEAKSSTIAVGGFELPAPVMQMLGRYRLEPDAGDVRALALYLNRGWSVMVSVFDPAPGGALQVGPDRLPLYPDIGVPIFHPATAAATRVYVLDDEDFSAPDDERLRWSPAPWAPLRPEASGTLADCAEHLDPLASGDPPFPDPVHVTRTWWRPSIRQYAQLRLSTVQPALPSRASGSAADLFLCLFLGVAPLVLAPESWLLMAFGSGRSLRRYLWLIWPIIVAAFWFTHMPGWARIAALAPLVAAILYALWPSPPEESRPVRVRFEKKKKRAS